MTYQIETLFNGEWTTEGIGDVDANAFETRDGAEQMIAQLRQIGPDWADAEYRVVELVAA